VGRSDDDDRAAGVRGDLDGDRSGQQAAQTVQPTIAQDEEPRTCGFVEQGPARRFLPQPGGHVDVGGDRAGAGHRISQGRLGRCAGRAVVVDRQHDPVGVGGGHRRDEGMHDA
jgi:hypothetical protein